MSPEILLAYILKGVYILGGFLLSLVLWVTKNNHVKLQNTYTKQETDKAIDLRLSPLQERVDTKMDALMIAVQAASTERQENYQLLRTIQQDVAVVNTKVDNLKERLDRLEKEKN